MAAGSEVVVLPSGIGAASVIGLSPGCLNARSSSKLLCEVGRTGTPLPGKEQLSTPPKGTVCLACYPLCPLTKSTAGAQPLHECWQWALVWPRPFECRVLKNSKKR